MADLTLDAPAPPADAAPPPDWNSVESHDTFLALPTEQQTKVIDAYANTVRDHALTLPGADPAQVDAAVSAFRDSTTKKWTTPAFSGQEIKASPTFLHELEQGNAGNAASLAWKPIHNFFGGLLTGREGAGPNASLPDQIGLVPAIADFVMKGGSITGNLRRATGIGFPTYTPQADDSAATRFFKAGSNVVSGEGGLLDTFSNPAAASAVLGKSRVLSAAFAGDIASHLPEQWKQVQAAESTPAGSQERWEAGLNFTTALALAGGAAGHAAETKLSPHLADNVTKMPDAVLQTAASDAGFKQSAPKLWTAVVEELGKRDLAAAPDQAIQIAAGDPGFTKSAPEQHAALTNELARRGLEPITDPQHIVASRDASDATLEQAVVSPEVAGHPSVLAAAKAELGHRASQRAATASDASLQIAAGDTEWAQQAPTLHAAVVTELAKRGLEPVAAQDVASARQRVLDAERQAQQAKDAGLDETAKALLERRDAAISELKSKASESPVISKAPAIPPAVDTSVDNKPLPAAPVETKSFQVNVNTGEHKNLVKSIDATSAEDAVAKAKALPDVRFVHSDTVRESPFAEQPKPETQSNEKTQIPSQEGRGSQGQVTTKGEQNGNEKVQSAESQASPQGRGSDSAQITSEADGSNPTPNSPEQTISPVKDNPEATPVTAAKNSGTLSNDLATRAATHFDRLTAVARSKNAPDPEAVASDAIQAVADTSKPSITDDELGAHLGRSLSQKIADQFQHENRLKRGGGESKISLDQPIEEGRGSVSETIGTEQRPDATQYKNAVEDVIDTTNRVVNEFAGGDQAKADAINLILREQGFANGVEGRPSNAAKELAADPAFRSKVQKGVFARIAEEIKSRFDESVLDAVRLTNNNDAVNQAAANILNLFEPGAPSRAGRVVRGWFGAVAGKTLPRFTAADREVGEKGARFISSQIAAEPLAGVFANKVLEGLDVDAKKFGAALTEDNLRSVREQNLSKADEATKAGDDKLAAEYRDRAANTASMIGVNKPFKNEAEYQSFLAADSTRIAIGRHKDLWEQQVDPMYRKAQSIDPEEELPARGLQTGARINLFALKEGEKGLAQVAGSPSGGLTNTLKKKSPFAIEAKGTASNYETAYGEIIKNTFGRQLSIANYNDFVASMVDKGVAQIGKPGQHVEIDGEKTVSFPLQRRTIISGGNVFPANEHVYVKASLASEFRSATNVDPSSVSSALAKYVFRPVNNAALYGLTDATVHVSNLATALFTRPAVAGGTLADTMLSAFGRADIPVTLVKAVVKGLTNNKEQMAELASIGAARAESRSTTWGLGWSNKMIHWADKTTRLVLDDAFQSMAKAGLVEDTETNRREFVNQVGQYNRRASTGLTRTLKDAGIAPFATAGATFNRLGLRMVGLQVGVSHTSALSHAITSTNIAAKWIGAAALIGITNYLLTHDKGGGVLGRPGVPLGNIDTGMTDENDKPQSIPAADLIGLGRGLRATGIRGAVQASRNGLTPGDVKDAALRDVVNTAISPYAGPAVRAGSAVLFNRSPGIGTPPINHVVAPTGDEEQKSQIAHNIVHALGDVNPGVAAYLDRQENPSLPTSDVLKRQLPRFTLRPSNSSEMMDAYPTIVHKAQVNSFIEDTIYTARRLKPDDRADYVERQTEQLPAEDQKHLRDQLKRRKVNY